MRKPESRRSSLRAALRATTARFRTIRTITPNCHDAVDAWTATHAGTQPVRGWLVVETEGAPLHLVAHCWSASLTVR
ncbi:hypothetical protein B0G80_1553 [Paraburkholderia sp. BL6669N2]|nr:hypothetical protein B0G80_1553 [Paraburkholderia sp. BL6669N2]